MRRLGYRVADMVAAHLANIRAEPVIASAPRSDLNAAPLVQPPAAPDDFDSIVATLDKPVFP